MKYSFLLLVALSAVAPGADLTELFESRFHKNYEPRHCGRNALGLIQAAEQELGAADSLYLVTLENKGFSVFGMVNAEYARDERRGEPHAGEKNWYHHVFVIDDAGNVYDFDYGTEPRVVKMRDYLETMFLDEDECGAKEQRYGEFCAGREEKMKSYELTAVPGKDALRSDESGVVKAKLGKVHQSWRALLPE